MKRVAAVSIGQAPGHRGRFLILAMFLAILSLPAQAGEPDEAAKSNAVGSKQVDVSWVSGGVGDEAMAEMLKLSAGYNVQVLMTGQRGNYLAGIPFTLSRRNGEVMLSGVTEGPLLYLKLPGGNYLIAVEVDGKRQSRQIQVSNAGPASRLRFVSQGE